MADEWRQHLSSLGDGNMRIKAHGKMKVDARLVTDENHLQLHADDRGPEQLVNAASLPGIVGEAWGMADWHFGYGLPIGGVVATDTEYGDLGGAISPGGDLNGLIGCKVKYGFLEDQSKELQTKIRTVPVIVVFKGNRAIKQWTADLTFRLDVDVNEIQQVIDRL